MIFFPLVLLLTVFTGNAMQQVAEKKQEIEIVIEQFVTSKTEANFAKNLELLKRLDLGSSSTGYNGEKLLGSSIRAANINAVKYLLDIGVSSTTQQPNGKTPIQTATDCEKVAHEEDKAKLGIIYEILVRHANKK
jgi:ankyrin repeat protein